MRAGLTPNAVQWWRCGGLRGPNLAECVAVRRRFRAKVGVFWQSLTSGVCRTRRPGVSYWRLDREAARRLVPGPGTGPRGRGRGPASRMPPPAVTAALPGRSVPLHTSDRFLGLDGDLQRTETRLDRRVIRHRISRSPSQRIVHRPEMGRRRPAAASDDSCAGIPRHAGVLGHEFRSPVVPHLHVCAHLRQAAIALRDDGRVVAGACPQAEDRIEKLSRAHAAVRPDPRGAGTSRTMRAPACPGA